MVDTISHGALGTAAELQSCVDELATGTHVGWARNVSVDGNSEDDFWAWQHLRTNQGHAASSCRLFRPRPQSVQALRGRWVLVVGDSRGRILYSAMLALVNSSTAPLGWPTHRVPVDDQCLPHVPREAGGAIGESWGWFNPACQLRWKGPCWDDVRGRNVRDVCTLDFTHTVLRLRLTFVWHSINSHTHVAATRRKVALLVGAAGQPADFLVVATGLWDMVAAKGFDPDCCCARMRRLMDALHGDGINGTVHDGDGVGVAGRALSELKPAGAARARVVVGLEGCPRCNATVRRRTAPRAPPPQRALGVCANWGGTTSMEAMVRTTAACQHETAKAAGFALLDVAGLMRHAPPMLSSPCGNFHPFGVQAEGLGAVLLGALAAVVRSESGRKGRAADSDIAPAPRHDAWPQDWDFGHGTLVRCESVAPCAVPLAPTRPAPPAQRNRTRSRVRDPASWVPSARSAKAQAGAQAKPTTARAILR